MTSLSYSGIQNLNELFQYSVYNADGPIMNVLT